MNDKRTEEPRQIQASLPQSISASSDEDALRRINLLLDLLEERTKQLFERTSFAQLKPAQAEALIIRLLKLRQKFAPDSDEEEIERVLRLIRMENVEVPPTNECL